MHRWIPLLLALGCTPEADDDSPPDDGTQTATTPTGGAGDLTLESVPSDDPLSAYFSKQVLVFGIPIVATATTPDGKVLHAAGVMAQYLDNDEDGSPDQAVVDAMIDNRALLVMFATETEIEESGLFDDPALWDYWGQDLYGSETNPANGFDASLEEVLHLIQTAGYASIWPDDLGVEGTTTLTEAMELARGGHFEDMPQQYPESAWYHYDDRTCDYACMAVEYFYWGLTTHLGAQSDRCEEIDREWELCTPELLESGDPALHALLTDPEFGLPTILPDGDYRSR